MGETDETSEKEEETRVAEACPTVAEEENKGSEDEATGVEDIVEDSDNINPSPDLSDIMAMLTSDLDLHNQTNDQLHTLYRHLSHHSRQVETMKESVAQVLFGRLDKNRNLLRLIFCLCYISIKFLLKLILNQMFLSLLSKHGINSKITYIYHFIVIS